MPGTLAVLVLLIFGIAQSLWSGTAQVLEHSPDARSNAMGAAGTADTRGAAAMFLNPAGLASLKTLEIAAAYHNELSDVNAGSAAFAMPFMHTGALGLSFYSLHAGLLDLPDREDDPAAELDFILSATYALSLASLFNLPFPLQAGVTAKYFHSTLAGEYTGQAVAGDGGLQTAFLDNRLGLGATLRNFGSPMTYDVESEPLPTSAVFGATWRQTLTRDFSLLGSADYAQPLDGKPLLSAGTEIRYLDLLRMRLGYRFLHDATNLTAGFGVHWDPYTVDYAFLNNALAAQHMLTLTYAWIPVKPIPSSLAQRGIDLFQQGSLPQARQAWQQALQENPVDVYAKKYLDEFEDARADWVNRRAAVAEQDFQEKRYAQAWALWQSLASAAPGHPRTAAGMQKQRTLADQAVSRARDGYRQRDWTSAFAAVDEALLVIPDYPPALEMQQSIREALQKRQQRAVRLPTSEQTAKIKQLSQAGKPAEALALVRHILSAPSQSKAVQAMLERISQWAHQKALELKSLRRYQSALALWESILKINPNHQPSRTAFRETSEYFQASIRKGNEEAAAAFSRKDYVQAIASWEAVYALDPEPAVRDNLVRAHTAQGILAYRDDDLARALTHWRKALAIDPENVSLQKNIQRAENKLAFIQKLGWEVSP